MATRIFLLMSFIEAEECFKRQLKIIAKEGTMLAIIHKFQYEVSSASQISPQFHDCLFTPSNITASFEAYAPTIADKSLSLSLCGIVKPSDRCERTSFS
ncbi:hypothetical protein V1477_005720 [Vespula maculifrons]|uniref:Uncharacterized protein n=1 Tax=Vespula maculifrons TaxID=7453 RepID=A0ABD2CLT4_VESMC